MKKYDKHNDSILVAMIAKNTEPEKSMAFSELYNRYNSKIYLYLKKVFGENDFAEDVFQDTFIKLLKSIESGAEIVNIQGYLLRTARNLSLNFKRDNLSNKSIGFEEHQLCCNDNTIEQMELSELIESVLELIPEAHKEAFILQTYYGLSYSEIAHVTDVPITTVRNRIVRAKSKLRELIAPIIEESN